jgi:hypothetical protein
MEIENSVIMNYVYNETGKIGGYPMIELLQKEINKQNILGGKINNSELGIKKFENLVIPLPLLSFSNEYYMKGGEHGKEHSKQQEREKIPLIKEKMNETIDNELFNKVFDLITKCPGKSKTRKNLEEASKKIQKNTKKYKKI